MRIDLRRVETLLEVFYELVVESLEEVTLEDAVGGLPVPVAMVNVIPVALVVVAHLVPFDGEMLSASEGHIGRQRRVIIDGQGQRPHIPSEDLLGLSLKSEK